MTHRRGTASALLVVAGTALFGTVGTARVLGPDIPSASIAAGRLTSAALLLVAIALLCGRARSMRRAVGVPWVYLAGVGQAGFQVCFLAAVVQVGVATGTLVAIGCTPIVAGLLTRNVTGRWAAATALSVVGLVLLVGGSPGRVDPTGVAVALGASLSYATYIVAARRLVSADAADLGVLAVVFSASGLLVLPLLLLVDAGAMWTGPGVATVLYLAVVPTVLAYALFNAGLRGVTASTAATLGLTEPVVAAGLGVLVLGEDLGLGGLLGSGLVLAGLLVLVTARGGGQSRP